MTYEETIEYVLGVMRENDTDDWHVEADGLARAIRTGQTCPVCYAADVEGVDAGKAGKAAGFDPYAVSAIASAADFRTARYRGLRLRLLQAARLTPDAGRQAV